MQIPGITKRLNRAEPAMVPIPILNFLKKTTAYSAINNSGRELATASKVAPFTDFDNLK